MVTPNLKALRRRILAGEAGPVRAARDVPPPVPPPTGQSSPQFIPNVPRPPSPPAAPAAPPLDPNSLLARIDRWLDDVYSTHFDIIAVLGAALGFGIGLHNATTAPSFGAAWGQVFIATIAGFLFTGIAAGVLYHVGKVVIRFRQAVATLALLILAATLFRACQN